MACLPVFNKAYLLHHWDTSISVIHGGTRPVSRDVALIILLLQLLSFYGYDLICLHDWLVWFMDLSFSFHFMA